jgi:hypothetical protein
MDAVLVAIITALATLIGVAIPLGIAAVQGNKKDKRDRQDAAELERRRLLQEQRKECAALLRMARCFAVAVQNNYEYHGEDKTARVWDIRQQAAEITSQADEIGLLVADLSTVADALAGEVNLLVGAAADPQSLLLGSSTQPRPPETTELDQRIKRFKSAAQSVLYGQPSSPGTSLMDGELLGELTV